MIHMPALFFFATALNNDSTVVETLFYFGVGMVLSALLLMLALRPQGENRGEITGSITPKSEITRPLCVV